MEGLIFGILRYFCFPCILEVEVIISNVVAVLCKIQIALR